MTTDLEYHTKGSKCQIPVISSWKKLNAILFMESERYGFSCAVFMLEIEVGQKMVNSWFVALAFSGGVWSNFQNFRVKTMIIGTLMKGFIFFFKLDKNVKTTTLHPPKYHLCYLKQYSWEKNTWTFFEACILIKLSLHTFPLENHTVFSYHAIIFILSSHPSQEFKLQKQ